MPVEACSEKPPLSSVRDAAAELDHLEPARDLAHRVGGHLAVLEREQPRDVLAVRVEELPDPEEELGALRERERAPGGERGLRGLHRAVDLLDGREVDGARLLAGRRVVDRAAAARLAGDGLPADPVVDRAIPAPGPAGASAISVICSSSRLNGG